MAIKLKIRVNQKLIGLTIFVTVLLFSFLIVTIRRKRNHKELYVNHSRYFRMLQPLKIAAKHLLRQITFQLRYQRFKDPQELKAQVTLKSTQEVAETLGNMKGALMKLGQLASFLDDSLPPEARQSLATLQKNAPPMSKELTFETFKESFGKYPDQVFKKFNPLAFAAASIGQVHFGITRSNEPVAVKIQYPNIKQSIESDLNNLNLLALIKPFFWNGLDLNALVKELRQRLLEEVDYQLEAKNQMLFYDFYYGHPFIRIPKVYKDLTTDKILTTEFINGKTFDELLSNSQHEKDLAAEAIYRFAFRSIYQMLAFNGDPHPGNYLFHGNGKVTFLDFGLVKYFEPEDVIQVFDIIKYGALLPDKKKLRQAIENCGFIEKNAPVKDEELYDFSEVFLALIKSDSTYTISPQWASEVSRRVIFGHTTHKNVVKHANLPANYAILQRINLGLLAVLGQLNASANWRRISQEIWPWYHAEPSTPLGILEQKWLSETKSKSPNTYNLLQMLQDE